VKRFVIATLLISVIGLGLASVPVGGVPASAAPVPASSSPPWVRDSVQYLDIFLPDADSDYYIDGFGTAGGARTVISGQVPHARYWSFTAYPLGGSGVDTHVHDTDVQQSHGRYTVTLSSSCAGIEGTCVATAPTGTAGLVVLRLYVPVDLNGAGTGGVPLPAVTYENANGAPLTLSAAAAADTPTNTVNFLRLLDGKLPAALTRPYPADAPVPTAVTTPVPTALPTGPKGTYANPDNLYDHMALNSTRGNLVISAKAPTYQSDSFHAVNSLGRRSSQNPQTRYWSVCVVLTGRATGDCLRDEQVHVNASGRFTIVVAPACPVARFRNCLVAGPEAIQVGLAYRNLLPSRLFASQAFKGPYALTGNYVARPAG
jgi:hypothetical protein